MIKERTGGDEGSHETEVPYSTVRLHCNRPLAFGRGRFSNDLWASVPILAGDKNDKK